MPAAERKDPAACGVEWRPALLPVCQTAPGIGRIASRNSSDLVQTLCPRRPDMQRDHAETRPRWLELDGQTLRSGRVRRPSEPIQTPAAEFRWFGAPG